MQAVGAVIFDLGRVLIGLDLERGIFKKLAQQRGEPLDVVLPKLLDDPLYANFSTGRMEASEFHRSICERLDMNMSYPEFVDAWCEVLVPMPGMDVLLGEVADRWPIGLLSDTDPIHWNNQLQVHAWLGRIPKPTLSFETGLLKPDPGCYRAAAQAVQQPLERCLFIDDLERNVLGARKAGMQSLVFEGRDQLRCQLTELGLLASQESSI